jgi:hypothetical protein
MLFEIGIERLPPREQRRNQRGVKRKMSNYHLRTQPTQDTSREKIRINRPKTKMVRRC